MTLTFSFAKHETEVSKMLPQNEMREFLTAFARRIARMEENALSTGLDVRVTPPEIRIIEKIGPDGSARMGNVARALGITLATLTVACDKLEKKELVERRRDPHDKRTVCISLTPRGLVAYRYHESFHQELLGVMLKGLSADEQRILMSGIRNLSQYLTRTEDGQKE